MRSGEAGIVRSLACFLLFLCLLAIPPGALAVPQVLVVTSGAEGVYAQISRELKAGTPSSVAELRIVEASHKSLPGLVDAAERIVTVGTRAADTVYALAPDKPVISALITAGGFSHLAARHFGSEKEALARGVSALLLDQPVERLYRLGKLLLPDARAVGVIAKDAASAHAAGSLAESVASDMHFTVVTLDAASSPITTLNPVIGTSDFVIALPGKRGITVSAARWILQISSHQRTPVIAYSRKYAVSGAMAAVYASPADVAGELLSLVKDAGYERLPRGRLYQASRFSVEINHSVARVLGITVREPQYYRQAILEWEAGR